MYRPGIIGERAIALFVFSCLAFMPPILGIFSKDTMVFGVPLLYGYLMCAWAVVVLLIGIHASAAAREGRREQRETSHQDTSLEP